MGPRSAVINFLLLFFPLALIPVFFLLHAAKIVPALLIPISFFGVGIGFIVAAKWKNLARGTWHSFGMAGMTIFQQKMYVLGYGLLGFGLIVLMFQTL